MSDPTRPPGPRIIAGRESTLRIAWAIVGLWMVAPAAADIQLPVPDLLAPVRIDGAAATRWQQGAVEVWVIQGCEIQQDFLRARADEAVLWVDRAAPMRNEDRLMNPLGFQVTSYRRDAESPATAPVGVVAPALPAATVVTP